MLPKDFNYGYGSDDNPYESFATSYHISYYNHYTKDGKIRKKPELQYCASFTFLRKCHYCGKLSTPKKVQIRNFFGGENRRERKREGDSWICHPTCVGCWNKIRILSDAHFQCRENKRLINKILRENRVTA